MIPHWFDMINTLPYFLHVLQVIINLLFASAVAKDSGRFVRLNQQTILVSGMTWAFATLLGGVFIAAIYWILHYSTLTRANSAKMKEEKL